jgi:hypothetical protein
MGPRHMAVLSAFASWACSRQRLQLQLSCPGLHFQPQRQMKRRQPRPLHSKSTTGMLHSLSRGRGPIAPGMADYLRTALDKYGSSLTSRSRRRSHSRESLLEVFRSASSRTRPYSAGLFGQLNGSREGFSRQDLGCMTIKRKGRNRLGQIAYRRGDLRGAAPLSD